MSQQAENKTDRSFRRWIVPLFWGAFLVSIDQVTKRMMAIALADGPISVIKGVFEFLYVKNHGAAFGVMQNRQMFFIIITWLMLFLLIWFYARMPLTKRMRPLRICCTVLGAGAVGNLLDRIELGYVRDFLYFKLIDFPVFNVADIYVTVAAAALCVLVLFCYKEEELSFTKKGERHE